MTDEQWAAILEKLSAPLKQGVEAVSEQGKLVVSCEIATVTMEIAPGMQVATKLVCFIAIETMAALMDSTVTGALRMSELAAAQFQKAMDSQPKIIKPS